MAFSRDDSIQAELALRQSQSHSLDDYDSSESFALLSDDSQGIAREHDKDKGHPEKAHRSRELEKASVEQSRSQLEHVEDGAEYESISRGEVDDARVRDYIRAEHELTLLQAVNMYPMAIFWCLVASACVVMEGYDTILIGNFFAYPMFAAKYGQFIDTHGQHQLTAAWQAALGNSSSVGCFLGVFLNGHIVNRLGQKRVLLGALLGLCGTVCFTFFAPNIVVLMIGELLCGIPWGIFASSAPTYASEVLPLCLRPYLTSYTNMCFIIGQLIAAGILAGLVDRTDEWSFRIPFALQWAWPAVITPVLLLAPESPWHLVRTRQLDKAEASLCRLQRQSTAGCDINAKSTLAHIVQTNEMEKRVTPGTSYWDCFRGIERRRTEIACMAFAGQVLAGSAFAYNSTYFFQQVGLQAHQTYILNTGGTALAFVGTLVNWFALMPRYGRRQIYLWGIMSMTAILVIIGVLNIWLEESRAVGMIQAILTLTWTFVFQVSIGQLGWTIPAEVSSTRLRQKTVCLARNSYYIAQISGNVVQPYFMNPDQLNLKGYASFFWSGTALLTFTWAFFRLPETRGRTYEELDWLFAKKTPTRKFGSARVHVIFNHEHGTADDYGEGNEDEDAHEMDAMVY
ncbi:alpha-glucoside:hydrogen symporter [Grosmannia clavigera kw1407]|uniref:Alpha-glucoside:hydrogen symporter n=1 Tax=Grosmannia clavigera (strain kw1407 / UAMH 11150) TaxID=655863 RepID=F0XL22_GROCL|nr:alpha-glucoside:hydrogen symporter [Grosmannia clavigera kw1407]EFX01607.1 alpha-glucoside:hydrogen symporter [Grosmannia clavigera kw1407]